MTSINKLLLALTTTAAVTLGSCTKNFRDINTDPNALYPSDAAIDYSNLGEPMNQAQLNILSYVPYIYQVQQNLNADCYSGYFASGDPFYSNVNNLTYSFVPGWNQTVWDQGYNAVMGPIATVLAATKDPKYAAFYAWAKIVRVEGMHRVSDVYGPIVYQHYGSVNADGSSIYDSQADVYSAFFSDLDSSITTLSALSAASTSGIAPFSKFDLVYGGSYKQWIKFANTLRLRLAIRVSSVNSTLAKTEGEKSLGDATGLLSVAADNANVNTGNNVNPINTVANAYGDINMGGPLVSLMNGYKDPRIAKYAQKATDATVTGQYIGIRQGIQIRTTDYPFYAGFSLPAALPNQMQIMTAAEAWFLKAEAALKGWTGAGDAQTNYETGIKTSFAQYGLDASAYITDGTSTAQPYVDPRAVVPGANDVLAGSPYLSAVTIAWKAGDADAVKLEKIITQKWIANFPEGQEAWSEFRRTLYPKLWPVLVNNSGGTISSAKFVRRLSFAADELTTDAAGVAKAIILLGGPDTGGTPLWWDTNPK